MRFYMRKYRCFFRGTTVLGLSLFFLFFGAILGYFYQSERAVKIPFAAAWQSVLFYGGNPERAVDLSSVYPLFSDAEPIEGSSLSSWEVTYYYDDLSQTEVPVFYGETTDAQGAVAAMGSALIRVSSGRELSEEAEAPPEMSVLIYCTHTAESYDGKADENGRGEVLKAAGHLADILTSVYGIGAVVSDTVHDSPDWYQSYANSKATAEKMMAEYPEADLIIDLHRDSGTTKEDCTVSIDGKNAAKMLLVVGSDVNLEHPNWEQNWETAKALGEAIDAVDPSLLRGVRVQKGRYNQHLSTNCVLLEVGTNLNLLSEAEYSAELAAKAISEYLQKQE